MSLRGSIAAAAAIALVSACYSPELRDCAVQCGPAGACADGLECGDDGFCHTPGSTDMCAAVDAGATVADTADADPALPDATAGNSDAGADVTLNVTAAGPGRIRIPAENLTCNNSCQYSFPSGTELTIRAIPNNMNVSFDGWTGDVCGGEPPLCTFTLSAPTSVTASFSN